MTKDEIIGLLNQGNIDDVFDELDKFFLGKDPVYKDLNDQYISRPENFSLPSFRGRLNRFISVNQEKIKPAKEEQKKGIDFYDLLCKLELKPQSTYFRNTFRAKKVSAVLLHGENDDEGNDLKWLYHQLLKKHELIDEPPILIDFSGSANSCFEDIVKDLCNKLDLPHNSDLNIIRRKIETYLDVNNLVFIIKYTKKLSNLREFYSLFNNFFSFLHKNTVSYDKSLIFLLIEDNTEGYKENLDDSYFLWFEEEKRAKYGLIIRECNEPKIIDLAPIEKVNESTIEKWMDDILDENPGLRNSFSCHIGNAQCFLEGKSNPYHVIQKLYSELKIDETKNPSQWLKY